MAQGDLFSRTIHDLNRRILNLEKGYQDLSNDVVVIQSGQITGSGDLSFTTESFPTVPNSEATFALEKESRVLFTFAIEAAHEQTTGGANCSGRMHYAVEIDGEMDSSFITVDAFLTDATSVRENIIRKSYATSFSKVMAVGSHTLSLRYNISIRNNMTGHLYVWDLTYAVLGKE